MLEFIEILFEVITDLSRIFAYTIVYRDSISEKFHFQLVLRNIYFFRLCKSVTMVVEIKSKNWIRIFISLKTIGIFVIT